jgi:hypothetical protein
MHRCPSIRESPPVSGVAGGVGARRIAFLATRWRLRLSLRLTRVRLQRVLQVVAAELSMLGGG